ncbi:hypothetical protein SteCoe_35055 [Stentor coeruleus]|uniref:Uncharacterized protein n=1 Tax=Stentor coeruleus TaxID=5963 RepID=A0A1R2AT66_9CILI|nr:hypothetical protein SteCoe_35055 [Stentor coeruleus]
MFIAPFIMEISRTIRDDLTKAFGFITADKKQDLSNKRSRSRSSTPQPRTSAKSQLDKPKMPSDMEVRQKKVEEFKKKQEEKKKMTAKSQGDTEIKSKQGQVEVKNVQIVKENTFSVHVIPKISRECSDLFYENNLNPQKVIESDKEKKTICENENKSLCITKTCDFKCNFEKEMPRGRQKGLRNEFPKRLLEDYPFLRSPDRKNDMIFKLFDSNCSKYEVRKAIGSISLI